MYFISFDGGSLSVLLLQGTERKVLEFSETVKLLWTTWAFYVLINISYYLIFSKKNQWALFFPWYFLSQDVNYMWKSAGHGVFGFCFFFKYWIQKAWWQWEHFTEPNWWRWLLSSSCRSCAAKKLSLSIFPFSSTSTALVWHLSLSFCFINSFPSQPTWSDSTSAFQNPLHGIMTNLTFRFRNFEKMQFAFRWKPANSNFRWACVISGSSRDACQEFKRLLPVFFCLFQS